jgi:hypothetical protein
MADGRAAGSVQATVDEAFEPEDWNATFGDDATAADTNDPLTGSGGAAWC